MTTNESTKKYLIKNFLEKFGILPDTFVFSPGRINIIGEHIDYNGGLVLPASISLGIYAAIRTNEKREIRLFSDSYSSSIQFVDFSNLEKKASEFINYFKGCIKILLDNNYKLDKGFDIYFKSTLPSGAGLSSSAALEMLIIKTLIRINNLEIDKIEVPKLGKLVENKYIGVNSGIMDQFAIYFGQTSKALLLNTNTLDFHYVDVSLPGYSFILINSNVKHKLETSNYNTRVSECQSALSKLSKVSPYNNLCEIPLNFLETNKDILSNVEYLRAKHCITEQDRIIKITESFKNRDAFSIGKLLNESHESLKVNYEVTCEETDYLNELSRSHNCLGSRQMGGGFGGCVILLISYKDLKNTLTKIKLSYDKKYQTKCKIYPINLVGGTEFF